MREIDVIILEYLNEIYPSREPPAVIYHNLMERSDEFEISKRVTGGSFVKNTLINRLNTLEDRELVKTEEGTKGYRHITESGMSFIRKD